jgi:hypothetical protein
MVADDLIGEREHQRTEDQIRAGGQRVGAR